MEPAKGIGTAEERIWGLSRLSVQVSRPSSVTVWKGLLSGFLLETLGKAGCHLFHWYGVVVSIFPRLAKMYGEHAPESAVINDYGRRMRRCHACSL
jgi:hypothetical protein